MVETPDSGEGVFGEIANDDLKLFEAVKDTDRIQADGPQLRYQLIWTRRQSSASRPQVIISPLLRPMRPVQQGTTC